MRYIIFYLLVSIFGNVPANFQQAKIEPKELKCLVCKTVFKELNEAIASIDPSHQVDVGSFRLDAKGNLEQKKISQAKSEIHLSELIGSVCEKMDNYIRGRWKDDGSLTVFKLVDNGKMNSDFSKIDIIQDDDLNKSLKYYCEEIVEEHEEQIIQQYLEDTKNIVEKTCIEQANYCLPEHFIEKEHVEVPGSPDLFSQLQDLNKDFGKKENEEESGKDETGEDAIGEDETGEIKLDEEALSDDIKVEL